MASTEHAPDGDQGRAPGSVKDAIRAFVAELSAEPGVCGVGLFGSQARGTAGVDSDADVLVLVERGGFVAEHIERSGQDFEVVRLDEAMADQYFRENLDAAADAFPTAKILYDPDGRLGAVRDRALALVAQGKPPVGEARLTYLRFASEDQIRAAQRLATTDVAGARVVLYDKIRDLTSLFYDVRQLWTPHLKRRLASIAELDAELHALLRRLFATDVPLDEQIRLAHRAVGRVFEPGPR